ncbi:5138_t:CDS:1, partial [Cetraspora pellucida]
MSIKTVTFNKIFEEVKFEHERKYEENNKIYKEMQNEIKRLQKENQELQEKIKVDSQILANWQYENSILNDEKKIIEELRQKYESEKNNYENNIQNNCKIIANYQNENMLLNNENREIDEKYQYEIKKLKEETHDDIIRIEYERDYFKQKNEES